MDNNIYSGKTKLADMEHAYHIINKCGQDSQHYLSLTGDNNYFFGEEVYGTIPYILSGNKILSLGDPVCQPEDMDRFLGEYLAFCQKMKYKPIFKSISSNVAEILKKHNYSVVKYGEEAVLKLGSYTLAGGKRATLRRNVARVDKSGVYLEEYDPKKGRDYVLERKIAALAEEWFSDKRLKLDFSVGELQFDKPFDRRYFVTKDVEGNLLTVLSFLPYDDKRGYCIDVMYRKLDSATGTMEHALISAAMKMKDEGVKEFSLGLAPLAGIDIDKPNTNRAEKLMNAMFHNMNFGYDFKNLYRFKKKFNPDEWKPRYLVYHKGISLVDLAIAITNAKQGVTDIALYIKYKFFVVSFTLFPRMYCSG